MAVSDQLQTSPYLTIVLPGSPSPIVYAVDELEPVRPDVTPPSGAAFGVIDLGRRVSWHHDPSALDALQAAAARAVARESLVSTYGTGVVSDLVSRAWLQRPDELCQEYQVTTAQIEVTAHCNWGCKFCPVSLDPKPSATMPMSLFEEIIEKISVHETLRFVTFHFYNEPSLDRFFEERLTVLQRYGIRLYLYTNASGLNASKLDAIERTGVVDVLAVNLPAIERSEFIELSQSSTYERSVQNLEAAIERGIPVTIMVNGAHGDVDRRVAELRLRYEPLGAKVVATLLSDRAGALGGIYHQGVRIEGPLRGCSWPVNHLHFSVKGDLFLCCNDFFQREVFGNIESGSVHELMSSRRAIEVRQRVFGVAEASADHVCRSCHDQLLDFPRRQFRPLASFPVASSDRCRSRR